MTPAGASTPNPYEPPGDLADEAARLDEGQLDELDTWAVAMARHPQGGEWRKRGERLVAEGQAGARAHFAYASLLAAQGERAEAARLLVTLCERLAQAGAWEAVARVARRALGFEGGPPAARWLVRAADEGGDADERFAALVEAHAGAPGEARLAWRLARAYEAAGDRPAALAATASALEALARHHDAEGMEDVLLAILGDGDPDYLRLTLPPLPLFAKGGEVARVASFLELSWPALAAAGLGPLTWRTLRAMLLELPDAGPLLPLVPDVVEAGLPRGAAARALLVEAGFGGGEPGSVWLPRLEQLVPFAPGAHAEHGSWGVGRVGSLSRDEVWIDFPQRPGHRMTLRAAHQALTPLDPEDLAVLASWQPERLAELRERDPVDLVTRALARLGGEGATADLKRVLVRYAVPEPQWTSFWNRARALLAGDPRVDATEAYRGRFRLGGGTGAAGAPGAAGAAGATAPPGGAAGAGASAAEEIPLPRFDRGADARPVLSTLRRFLAQHADQAGRLARERGTVLRAWRDDPGLPWKDRLAALLLLAAGGAAGGAVGGAVGGTAGEAVGGPESAAAGGAASDAEDPGAAPTVVGRALADGFDLRELTAGADQRQVLEWGLASSEWEAAARSGLASRFGDVKERAFEAFGTRLGAGAAEFFTSLARRAVEWPDAALAVMERAYGRNSGRGAADRGGPLDAWEVACGLAELLEGGPGAQRAKAGLALLAPGAALGRAAAAALPAPETRARIERLLLGWRGSDRSLLPFLEWVEAAGFGDFTAEVRRRRHLAARAITADAGKVDAHELPRIFLTRATYMRLKREAEAVDQALRTEIPAAIQKARELGDLRENAEYESAKLKQRQAQARLGQLVAKLADVLIIDDLDRPPDVVGLGTEVELDLPGGATRRLWILGEGDDHLGPEVVSYRAPVGRALVGRHPGDAVELPADGGVIAAVVRAVRPRLPDAGAPPAGGGA